MEQNQPIEVVSVKAYRSIGEAINYAGKLLKKPNRTFIAKVELLSGTIIEVTVNQNIKHEQRNK